MSEILFWSMLLVIVATYVGYPLLLALRALLRRRPVRGADVTPRLSMIVCAYDEEASIGPKLENALSLDYPPQQLEILVASDGSTDATHQIVWRFASRGVRLLELPRRGKIPTLNAAVQAARGEILVFSDANSIYARNALRALVRPFADAEVGGVAGDQRYLGRSDRREENEGERVYWNLDRRLKQWQSIAGSVTSATGAIYAIRRELFEPVAAGVTDDFFVSSGVVAQGARLVFAPEAAAYEPVAASSDLEFQRKVRVITRGLRAVLVRRRLLNPFRHGFYAIQLFSHKVLRRLVVLPLLVLLVASVLCWDQGLLYRLALAGQLGIYGSAVLGAVLPARLARARLFALPFYFCMVNAAALLAVWNVLRGRRIERWQPRRGSRQPATSDAPQRAAHAQGGPP